MTTLSLAARALARSRMYSGYSEEAKEAEYQRNRSILTAEVSTVLRAIRVNLYTMDMVIKVARDIGETPATVDLCWVRMIDAILEEKP